MRFRLELCLGFVLLGVYAPAAAAPGAWARALAPAERRIVAEVDAATPGGLELLQRVVNVNSGTMNREGVHAVAELFRPEFEALGFRVRWVDGDAWAAPGT